VFRVYNNTGFPLKFMYCFGVTELMREPEPPATIMAYFFITGFSTANMLRNVKMLYGPLLTGG
jgi:hypothetical protein